MGLEYGTSLDHRAGEGGLAVVLWESLLVFRGTAAQVAGCDNLFLKIGS